MDPSLVRLMEELVVSIEQRDAGPPDRAVGEAAARIRALEDEIARRLELRRRTPVAAAAGADARTELYLGSDVAGSIA
jgi:hypothetical protein